jgi:hypothetical protein
MAAKKPVLKLSDKMEKVSDNFTVQMVDNGFMFEISGRDDNEDWVTAKLIISDIDGLVTLIKEASEMPRDS